MEEAVILYSSATGTAEALSLDLSCAFNNLGIKHSRFNTNEFNITYMPKYKIIIFIVSTTGDGVACSDFQKMWNFLRVKGLEGALKNSKAAHFGLGDSSYRFVWEFRYYNAVARRLY